MIKIDLTQSHDVIGAYKKLKKMPDVRMTHHDAATNYAFDVMDGKVISGYMIKLAAFRHLRDMQRIGSADFDYHFDDKEADRILKFAKICPDVDTGKPSELMPWEEFVLAELYGWRDEYGHKRFTRAVLSVSRGQGKTYLMAIATVYSYLVESMSLFNQDYLIASINYKQTSKLLGYVKKMLKKIIESEPFKAYAIECGLSGKVLDSQSDQIIMSRVNNILRAISHEGGQYDSFHFRTAIFDEAGELKTTIKLEKITSGQIKVPNHQFVEISTAYPDPSVPFHSEQKTLQTVMEQDWNRQSDDALCLVWAQDSLEETYKPDTWGKSNPLLGLKSQRALLMKGLLSEREAKARDGRLAAFQNKNLNMWLQEAADSYLKLDEIEGSIIPEFDVDNRQVYIGIDYSMFSDNTGISFVYPYQDEDGKNKWHVAQHSFIPWHKAGSIEAKEKQDGINYRDLAKRGFCTITSHLQGMINDDQVYQWIREFVEEHNLDVVYLGYDYMGVTNIIKMLELNTTWPLEGIRQRTSELKDPTKFLQKIFVENSITHLDDPIMEKALVNARIYEDKIGIQVDKAAATYKIDVVDAIIDAMYQAMFHFEDFAVINDPAHQLERMSEDDVKKWFNDPNSGMLGG